MHATTLAFCQTNREENTSWTWRDSIPNLSQTIENLDQLPFLKEITPKTLKLLEERDPSFKGSKWERDLLRYSEVKYESCFVIFNEGGYIAEFEFSGSSEANLSLFDSCGSLE